MKLLPYCILVPAIALATVFLVAACGGPEPAADPLSLVPAEAGVIAWLELDKIREEPALEPTWKVIREGGAGTNNQELQGSWDALVSKELGDFSRMLVFDVPGEGDNGLAFTMQGMPDREAVLAWADEQADRPLVETQYQGAAVFVDEPNMEHTAVSFLSDQLTVVGDPVAVYRVIDVHEGDSAPASGSLVESFQETGDHLAWVAVAATPETLGQASGGLGSLNDMTSTPMGGSLEDLEFLTLTISPAPDGLMAEAKLHFGQVESAEAAGAGIQALVQLIIGFSEDEQQRDLLGRVTVEVDGSRVVINLPLTGQEFAYLAATLSGG